LKKVIASLTARAKEALHLTSLPALMALAVVAFFAVFADQQDRQLSDERLRADVFNRVNLIRAKLEGEVMGDVQLARGLVSVIATEPHMTQARFADLAASVLGGKSQIRDFAGAPGLVVSLLYPVEGNEKAFGLDYRRNAQQREAALRVRGGEVVLAGPVNLVQGGRGFIVRFPVFTKDDDGGKSFWGIFSTVLDEDKLYRDAGLLNGDLDIDVAIAGQDGLGAEGAQFYGDPRVATDHPIAVDVNFPSGSWRITATPKGGWAAHAPNQWPLRVAIVVCGFIVVFPTWLIGRLFQERRGHFAKLKERERELERLSRRLELALDTSKVGVWELDLKTNELVWDDRMNELYGYPLDNGVRTYEHWRKRLDPAEAARAESDFNGAIEAKGRYNSQFKIILDDGRTRVIRTIGSVYVRPDSSCVILGVNWDVTADVALTKALTQAKEQAEVRNAELEKARARIEHNALHDFLTKLPNRMYLERNLEEHARRCAESDAGIVLIYIDLDRFKAINDTLGHPAGDAMLLHTAEIIRSNIRDGDFVARTGGDEFVIVCPADAEIGYFVDLARRLIGEIQKPVLYKGHECRYGMSIGIASAFGDAVDRERLLVNADIALYRAKALGRNRFEIYTDALQAEIVRHKQLADEIMAGLERGEFFPYFQPQFDARTLDLVGVEALVRWRNPRHGLVSPAEFLPIAEELNVVALIDRTILAQSLAVFRRWREEGLNVPRLSVNVALGRLREEGLVQSLRDLDIEPGALSFELLESIYLDETDEQLSRTIEQIKALGVDIEIDDFGTGYTSIVSLMRLRPRRLKIDRRLIAPVVSTVAHRRLVQSIVEIGKSLDIEIVAEGVETAEHVRLLRAAGCDFLQGFALAKPMASADLEQMLRARAAEATKQSPAA